MPWPSFVKEVNTGHGYCGKTIKSKNQNTIEPYLYLLDPYFVAGIVPAKAADNNRGAEHCQQSVYCCRKNRRAFNSGRAEKSDSAEKHQNGQARCWNIDHSFSSFLSFDHFQNCFLFLLTVIIRCERYTWRIFQNIVIYCRVQFFRRLHSPKGKKRYWLSGFCADFNESSQLLKNGNFLELPRLLLVQWYWSITCLLIKKVEENHK